MSDSTNKHRSLHFRCSTQCTNAHVHLLTWDHTTRSNLGASRQPIDWVSSLDGFLLFLFYSVKSKSRSFFFRRWIHPRPGNTANSRQWDLPTNTQGAVRRSFCIRLLYGPSAVSVWNNNACRIDSGWTSQLYPTNAGEVRFVLLDRDF
jgi:hypothetical protein